MTRTLEYEEQQEISAGGNDMATNTSALTIGSTPDRQEGLQNLVTAAVRAQQSEMFASLSDQLSRLIESKLEAGLSRLNPNLQQQATLTPPYAGTAPVNQTSQILTLPSVEQQTLEQLLGIPQNSGNDGHQSLPNVRNSNEGGATPLSNSSLKPDKVGHIIHNWKIKFTGDSQGISVDNFIYRVEALTTQTLNVNFNLLCDHISPLFDSKATAWFWRYHQLVRKIVWPNLCAALREQYKDSRTDVDFREMIRDRKQRANENFDSFYESVLNISDRLSQPFQENVLVEILCRNLLPEIQHEILNIKIRTVSELRDICRRREFFLQDIGRKQVVQKTLPFVRKHVNELDEEILQLSDDEGVSAISLICWNCQKSGHRYQDCLEDRKVFCYGCGASNVYKPKCTNCNNFSKNSLSSAPKSAHRQTKSTSTNTD